MYQRNNIKITYKYPLRIFTGQKLTCGSCEKPGEEKVLKTPGTA